MSCYHDFNSSSYAVGRKALSLSPFKTQLFMEEAVYGGTRVGKDSIKPNIAKLEAITKWPVLTNLHELMKFLGLMGYFHPLIKDYAHIAAPLTDLQCNLDLSHFSVDLSKHKYRQILHDQILQPYWIARHTKAFTQLKQVLISEPVLKAPKFDGMPFILTTDGCKLGFGTILFQKHTATLPNGEQITTIHLVGYGSKKALLTEECYKPY